MAASIAQSSQAVDAFSRAGEIVDQFVELANRYIQLPKHVHHIRSRLKSCGSVLDKWRRKWGVDGCRPAVYYKYFWGGKGLNEVERVIHKLIAISSRVENEVSDLVLCATPGRRQYDAERALDAIRQSGNVWRWLLFYLAVKRWAFDIYISIGKFEREFMALHRISSALAERRHSQIFSRSGHMREAQTNRATEEAEREASKISRQGAARIHEAFQAQDGVTCMLNLTVVELDADNELGERSEDSLPLARNCFQVLLTERDVTQEVLLKPICNRLQTVRAYPGFRGIIEEIQLKNDSEYVRLSPAGMPTGKGFRAYKVKDAELETLAAQQPLALQLDRLSKTDKFQTAYTLAQGYRRLLGSPWLNYIQCDHLRAPLGQQGRLVCLLDATDGSADIANAFEDVRQRNRRSNIDLTQHTQIYRLGILLAEIALNRTITRLEVLEVDHTLYPRIVLDDDDDIGVDPNVVAEQTANMLQQERHGELNPHFVAGYAQYNVGSTKYADAVYFCLSVFEQPVMTPVEDLTEKFTVKVLQPLTDILALITPP